MEELNGLVCGKCGEKLVEAQVTFEYLGMKFKALSPRCPICGQVYLPEELVIGKMKKVEEEFEGK